MKSFQSCGIKKNHNYMNKYKRQETLQKLLPLYKKIKPDASVKEVTKKLNTLRSNYRREIHKIKNSIRSGYARSEIYQPTSWVFKMLHFLGESENPVPLGSQVEIYVD